MGMKTLGLIVGTLGLVYSLNTAPADYNAIDKRYKLPTEITVLNTDLPYESRKKEKPSMDSQGNVTDLEKIVKTKDIDFSKEFTIETERYTLIKDHDNVVSRTIGHVMSIPAKIFFFDHNFGWGQDEDRTKATLAMLEASKDIKDLTVRVNHNEAFYDWYRMMTEDKLQERNPFLYRVTIGTLSALKNEIWAEFGRGDYYNPLSKTAVLYSNIESISAHELGHHEDFERYDTDWVYSLARILPPVMLYQEWKASENAKNVMSEEDGWQFNRYLMPAFATYCLGAIATMFKKSKTVVKSARKEEEYGYVPDRNKRLRRYREEMY